MSDQNVLLFKKINLSFIDLSCIEITQFCCERLVFRRRGLKLICKVLSTMGGQTISQTISRDQNQHSIVRTNWPAVWSKKHVLSRQLSNIRALFQTLQA